MTIRRRLKASATDVTVPGGQAEICDLCGVVISDGAERCATVADSSAVHPSSALSDGERRLIACGADHLDELVREYRHRPYDDEELWGHMLLRATRCSPDEPTLEDLAFVTGLTVVQVMRGMRWNSVWLRWLVEPPC